MRLASLVNQYVSDQAPWALVESDRARAGTVLHVALRSVDSLKTLFSPFLPFSSQTVNELLGYGGILSGELFFRDETEEDGTVHTILTGDYTGAEGRWAPSGLPAGQTLLEPKPLFRKLDPEAVVAEELARMERAARGEEPAPTA